MVWVKIMVFSAVAWTLMLVIFSYQLDSGESFHFGHYLWLLVAAVIIIWVKRRKSKKNKVIGNPI